MGKKAAARNRATSVRRRAPKKIIRKAAKVVPIHEAKPGVIIMAAVKGTRMKSPLPKVLNEICGQPLVFHILDAVREALPQASIALIVGHQRELVEEAVRSEPRFEGMEISFVHQAEQKGTGHAVICAMETAWGADVVKRRAPVLVLPGDTPLLPSQMIEHMCAPLAKQVIRLLTCQVEDPAGYGRVVRKGKLGPVLKIVEHKDANPKERLIQEINTSIYTFDSLFLQNALRKLSNQNAQGEYYLTDVLAQAVRARKKIEVLSWPSAQDLAGINNRWQLAECARVLNLRILKKWGEEGVYFMDPSSTWVETTVELGAGVIVEPGVILKGSTRVGDFSRIGAHSVLQNTQVGAEVKMKPGTVCEDSVLQDRVTIGPYAHLRPGSEVGEKTKIGNFVELKKTSVGKGTAISHLSYVGDALVGDGVNIGCGFVTCNYDGRVIDGQRKHQTVIEDECFIGSDCQTVAPVRLRKGSYVASGSTITQDVPSEALAIARSRQVNKEGYARRLKNGVGASTQSGEKSSTELSQKKDN